MSKAYQSVLTTEKEKFLRLVVWRFGEETADWLIFGFNCMTYGDVPASVLLEIVKSLGCSKYRDIDEMTAQRVEEDSYVDDILSGGTEAEVAKMKGDCEKKDGKFYYNGTVSRMLGGVNLKPKLFIQSVSYTHLTLPTICSV